MTKNFNKHKRKLSIALAISLILGQVPVVSVHGQENDKVIESSNVQTTILEKTEKEVNNISDVKSAEIINIPDDNLKAALNKILDKDKKADITNHELESLESLRLGYEDIRNLEGLQYCINLTSLDLTGNEIIDIGDLSGLKNLKTLTLSENKIDKISGLSGLSNLTQLDLNYNEIEEISGLSELSNLEYLNLDNNKIIEVSNLSGLKNLKGLYLSENKIDKISGLSELKNLEYLDLTGNEKIDISDLSGLKNLSSLDLSCNKIRDISDLSGLKNLSSLDLSCNKIRDISALSGLKNLRNLNLMNNEIRDISALSGLKNLSNLSLGCNKIIEINSLSEIKNLEYLNLENNEIRDISALSGLKNLRDLSLSTNKIREINALSELNNLECLNLRNNRISDITPLLKKKNISYVIMLNENYLNLADPKTKEVIKHLESITTMLFYEDQLIPSEEPVIEAKDTVIKVGDTFKPLSLVKVTDKEDGDITNKVEIIANTVNTSKAGVYKVVYSVTDNDKNTVTKEIKVTVLGVFSTFEVNTAKNTDTTISGKGLSGATVKAYVNGKQIGKTATVSSNGTYKITIPKQKANTKVVVKMSKSGYATTEKTITVLDTFATFTVNSINNKSTSISGKGLKGATVKAYVNGKQIGKTATVSSNGTYKITIPKQKANTKVVVKMSKSGYATTEKTITVLDTFATFTVNSINNKSTSISGKGLKGATVKAYVNGKQIGKTATVSSNGTYKITIPKQKANTKVVVKMSKSGYATTEKTIKVKK